MLVLFLQARNVRYLGEIAKSCKSFNSLVREEEEVRWVAEKEEDERHACLGSRGVDRAEADSDSDWGEGFRWVRSKVP